jgi:2-keto-myo-inositol isomerase
MILGLNGATTMKADLATDIQVAGQAGFQVVEIWAAKLDEFLKSHSLADVAGYLADAGVRAHTINSIEKINFRNAAGRAEVLERCQQLSQYAQAIGCSWIVVVPGPLPQGTSWDEVREETVAVLREMAAVAEPHGIKLAFEFLGFPWCSVRTLTEAWAIVAATDRSNVGVVLDTCHFYAGASSLASISTVSPARLAVCHINDVEDVPREQISDAHRLFPGDGVIPLKEIIQEVRSIGYQGVCSVELFRPEYWERDPLDVAQEARQKTLAVLGP